MELRTEVDRLQAVYREYGERGWGRTKWAATNEGNQAIRRERDQRLEQLMREVDLLPLDGRRILDVGCGEGATLAGFQMWGAKPENLFGIDLLAQRVQQARKKFPGMTFQTANAERIPFANGSFDIISVFTVFTSILDSRMAAHVGDEIERVLCPGGAVVWYDFRVSNPLNPHVKGISRNGILRLFPHFECRVAAITLLPPLARRLGRWTTFLYPCLAALPFLRSHLLVILRKR